MSSIDERIVQMQFDNKQFESGVATTIKSLDNLKNSLNLEGATKGFSNIEKSAKNVSLDSLANSVENISSKFNALSVVAVTVLQNITNQALSAAKSLVSAFTITPITDGLSEYETQINAIQTIYSNTSSKGTTLDQINTALDELNTYADKTIYNFTEMTRNIGTFTAAGVDLDTSVAAIKGIANLAAASGSTSQQASTAMYQLSQALATGTVKLMDWNSVVNAGMGGQLFQDSLLETARVHGIAVDDMIAKEGSFRESLSEGWLTSEVLLETLQKFTGDLSEEQLRSIGYTDDQIQSIIELGQNANDAATKVKTLTQLFDTLKEAAGSGWTQSWEIIIGDFEQARELWTGVSDTLSNIINNSAEARNNLLSAAFGERTFTSEDWAEISLTNSASTLELFKEQIIAVAKAHDVAIDDMIESEGSFAATLSSGWLTQDILTEALENIQNGSVSATASLDELGEVADRVIRGEFGNGQDRVEALTEAGYDYASVQALVNNKLLGTEVALDELSDTELENLGYTEEQIEALREFAATVDESGKTLNEVLAEMERPSGRTLLIESFANAWSGLVKVINAVGTAWNNVVPAFTSDTLYNALESLHSFSEVLIISDETADKITRTFQGLFAILDIVGQAVSALVGGFVDFIKFIAPAGDGVLSITGGIGDFIYAIDQALRETNLFNNIVKNIGTILAPVGNVIKAFASLLLDSVTGFIDFANADNVVVGVIESIGESLTPVSDLLSEGIEKVASFVAGLIQFADEHELVAKAVTAVKTALSTGISIASKWIDAFMNLPIVQSAIENIETTLNHLSECIEKALSGSYKKFSEFWNDLVSADGSGFEGIGNVFSNIVSTLSSAASGVIEFVQEIISSITSFKTDVSTNLDSVGSTFTAFKDTVSNAFSTLLDKLAGLDWGTIALVAGFLTTFAVAVKVVATTLKIVDAVADGIEGIGNLLSGIGSFGKSIGKIGKTLEKAATSLSKTVKQFKLTLTAQAISQIAAAIFKLVSAIAILAFLPQDKLLNGVFTITILMVGLVGVSKALSMMSIDASVTGVIISFAVAVYILASAVKSLAKLNLTDAVKSVVIIGALMLELAGTIRIMNGVSGGGASGGQILAFAVSIMLMAIAVKALAGMKLEDAVKSVAILGSLMLELAGTIRIMNGVSGGGASAGQILAFAVSILLMATAVKSLADIKLTDAVKSVGILGALMLELSLAMKFISKVSGGSSASTAFTLIAIAAAIKIMVSAIDDLDNMDLQHPIKVVGMLAAIIVAMTTMMKSISKFSGGSLGSVASLIAIPIAIKLMVSAFNDLDNMDTSNLLNKIESLAIIIVTLKAVMASAGQGSLGSAITLIAIPIAIELMVHAFNALAELDANAVLDNISSLGLIIGSIMALMLSTRLAGSNAMSAGVAIVLISGSMILLAAAMKMMAEIDEVGDLSHITDCISQIMLVFAACIAATGFSKKCTSTIVIMMVAIAGIAAVLYLLSEFTDVSRLTPIANALTEVMLAMSVMMVAIGASSAISKSTNFGMIAAAAVALVAIGAVLGVLAQFGNVENYIPIATAISEVVLAISVLMVAIGVASVPCSIGGAGAAIVTAAALVALVGIGTALGVLAHFGNAASYLPIALAISVVVDALTDLMESIGKAAILCTVGAVGIAAMVVAIAALSVLVLACAAVNALCPEANSFLQSGLPILETLGEAVGNFIGGILKGVLNSLSGVSYDPLTSMSDALSNFVSSLSGISVDESILSTVESLAGVILTLGAAELLDAITSFITGGSNMSDFADNIAQLGYGIMTFSYMVSKNGIDEANVTAAATAIETLANISYPKSGGLWGMLTGNANLGEFAENIGQLGYGLMQFNYYVSKNTLNESNMTAAATAIDTLANISYPTTGGLWGMLTGNANLETFAENLGQLGYGIMTFSYMVSKNGIDEANVTAAVTALSSLGTAASTIPNTGGLWGDLFGEVNVSDFAENVAELGYGIMKFSYMVSKNGIDEGNVTTAVNALSDLAGVAKDIPTDGGLWGEIFGGTANLSDFATGVEDLGEGISAFAASVSGVTTAGTEDAIDVAEKINDLSSKLTAEGGFWNTFINGDQNLGNFASEVAKLGLGLRNFSLMTESLDTTSIDTAIKVLGELNTFAGELSGNEAGQISQFIADLSGIALDGIESFASAFSDSDATSSGKEFLQTVVNDMVTYMGDTGTTNLETVAETAADTLIDGISTQLSDNTSTVTDTMDTIMTEVMNTALNILDTNVSDFQMKGLTLINGVKNGIVYGSSVFQTTVLNVVMNAALAAHSCYTTYYSVGVYLMSGLAAGISANRGAPQSAAVSAIANAALAVHSYYTQFYNVGAYMMTGLANGIAANKSAAITAAANAASQAYAAAKAAVDANSPAKKFIELGMYCDQGFAIGFERYTDTVVGASEDMALAALDTVRGTLSNLTSMITDDITDPVIRPVLDLSAIESGTASISGMFGGIPVLSTNVAGIGAVASSMREFQNGTDNSDLLAALKDLKSAIGDSPRTVNTINGITYDGSSSINDAIQTIVRVATVQQRSG